jgi:hypothetical protein
VSDIRQNALRLPLATGETFAAWSSACLTPGGEELRYIKFFLRAEAKGEPHTYDAAECAHVVASLRDALRTNSDALGGFWLGYTLKAQLQDAKGVALLKAWVDKHGGPAWWAEQWEPLVRKCAKPEALDGVCNGYGRSTAGSKLKPAWQDKLRPRSWLSLRCLSSRSSKRVIPIDDTTLQGA